MTIRSRSVTALALVAATISAGCAVGPDFVQPAPPQVDTYVPQERAARIRTATPALTSPGRNLPGAWWELLSNRRLSDLITSAVEANPDVAAANAAIRIAEHNRAAGAGAFWPTIQGKFDASRQLTPTQTLASNHGADKTVYYLYTPQLTITYVLDIWGGNRRQVEALDAQVEAAAFQREAAVLTLTSNLALAAIQQASFESQIAATRRLIAVQSELLAVLRRQQEAGQIALPDVLVQETALAQAKLLLPPLERQSAQQHNLIATLTGRFPSQTARAPFKLETFRLPRQVPVSLPANLVRQRPDVRVAEANLRQANAQIGVALAARYPQLTLTGNGGSTADAIDKLFSPGTWAYMLAGTAVKTIFDGRTLEEKQRAAEETFVQQTHQYRGVVLTAFQNVADALVAIEADARALRAAEEAEKAAQTSLNIIRQQLDQGQVSIPALLAAQQAYLQTSVARVQAHAARLAGIVALFQALGGGWWNRLDNPIAELSGAPGERSHLGGPLSEPASVVRRVHSEAF